MNRSKILSTIAATMLAAVALTLAACSNSGPSATPTAVFTAGSSTAANNSPTATSGSQASIPFVAAIREVVQQAEPAVVQITSQQVSVD